MLVSQRTVQEVIFDQEATKDVADLTLADAQEMAMDALDTSVAADEVRDATPGRYYCVEGPVMGRYLLVTAFEQGEEIHDPAGILAAARGL